MNIDGVLGAFTFILEKEVTGKNPYEKEENTISDRTKELSMKKSSYVMFWIFQSSSGNDQIY